VRDVEKYIAKLYEEGGTVERHITLTREEGWPEDFHPGRPIDLDFKIEGEESVRLFGTIEKVEGTNLTIFARVMGAKPVRVWSVP
jgi:hypothetical protein